MQPLLPFASSAELQTLKPEADDSTARLAVTLASARIRRAVGWDVDQQTQTWTKLYRSSYRGVLGGLDPALCSSRDDLPRDAPSVTLPAMNLTVVASVVVDDVVLSASQWDATTSGIIYLNGLWVSRKITVTFTAGYVRYPEDMAPGVFKEVCLEQAMSVAGNPERLRSYSIGGDSESFYDAVPLDEDTRLGAYMVSL